MHLNTEITRDGTMVVTRDNGEQVATIECSDRYAKYWVNMADGYVFSAMPMNSLEAAQYLVLASVLEFDAKEQGQ